MLFQSFLHQVSILATGATMRSMRSMRSMRWDLFSVIGGPCKRYAMTIMRSMHPMRRSMRGGPGLFSVVEGPCKKDLIAPPTRNTVSGHNCLPVTQTVCSPDSPGPGSEGNRMNKTRGQVVFSAYCQESMRSMRSMRGGFARSHTTEQLWLLGPPARCHGAHCLSPFKALHREAEPRSSESFSLHSISSSSARAIR